MEGIVGPAWIELRRLYQLGVKGSFDTMAVHVYPQTASRVFAALRLVRNELNAEREIAAGGSTSPRRPSRLRAGG